MMINEKFRLLVVDDEQDYCEVLKIIFESRGYEVDTCSNGKQALEKLKQSPFDAVISDLSMPVMDGYELLVNIKNRGYDCEVILLTAYGTIKKAVDAMKMGAYTYITKGTDTEDLIAEVENIREMRAFQKDTASVSPELPEEWMLESASPKYRQMLTFAERAAASDANILILGESGSGKEVLASYIHSKSRRRNGKFTELNCQALSESILESELFGHEKGAFTGATRTRVGLFENSQGGTLFLDEIGGVSLNLQAKLLKAIENKIIYRMGSSTPIKVDFQLIAATNHNLKRDIERELFREDLFYRISTIVLELPPLRERAEDIPLFLDHFIRHYSNSSGKTNVEMSHDVRDILTNYRYPGNIRELKNIIERVFVLSEHGEIRKEYLPPELLERKKESPAEEPAPGDGLESLKEFRSRAEQSYVEELLVRYPDDLNRVADILCITRRQLYNKLVEFGLR